MVTRRFVIGGALSAFLIPPEAHAVGSDYNPYAAGLALRYPTRGYRVRSGDTWQSLYGSDVAVQLAKMYNRQNVALEVGQTIVALPERATWQLLSPFPSHIQAPHPQFVVVSPAAYAFAFYSSGQLVWWGPAICGGDWCADVGRACRTPVGDYLVSEAAGPDRRSTSFPVIHAAEGRGAIMPYYMRLTADGVGLHARYVRGRHESHGCIGIFYNDAEWLNRTYAAQVPVHVRVERYGETIYTI